MIGIAPPALFVNSYFHFRFPLSGSVADILGFRRPSMSGHVGSDISESGVVENVGVAVGIASLTLALRVLFPPPVSTSGFVADILGFRCRPMSGCVGSAISRSGTVENMGLVVGTFSPSPSVQKLFPLRFRGRHFGFLMSGRVGSAIAKSWAL